MSISGERGKFGESYVRSYLERAGCKILASNFRVKGGEIDIAALSGDTLVFTEVKTRKLGSVFDGAEAITPAKCARLTRAAQRFVDAHGDIPFRHIRFDAALLTVTAERSPRVIELKYIEDAFTP